MQPLRRTLPNRGGLGMSQLSVEGGPFTAYMGLPRGGAISAGRCPLRLDAPSRPHLGGRPWNRAEDRYGLGAEGYTSLVSDAVCCLSRCVPSGHVAVSSSLVGGKSLRYYRDRPFHSTLRCHADANRAKPVGVDAAKEHHRSAYCDRPWGADEDQGGGLERRPSGGGPLVSVSGGMSRALWCNL